MLRVETLGFQPFTITRLVNGYGEPTRQLDVDDQLVMVMVDILFMDLFIPESGLAVNKSFQQMRTYL